MRQVVWLTKTRAEYEAIAMLMGWQYIPINHLFRNDGSWYIYHDPDTLRKLSNGQIDARQRLHFRRKGE